MESGLPDTQKVAREWYHFHRQLHDSQQISTMFLLWMKQERW